MSHHDISITITPERPGHTDMAAYAMLGTARPAETAARDALPVIRF